MSGPTTGNFEEFAGEYAGTQALARGGRQAIDGPRIIRRPGQSPILTNLTGERLDAASQQPQMVSGPEGGYEALSGDFGDFGGAIPRRGTGTGTGKRPVSGGMREGGVYSFGGRKVKGSGLGAIAAAGAQGRARKTSALLRQADRRTDIEQRRVNLAEGKNDAARASDEALTQQRLADAQLKRKQAAQMLPPEKQTQLKKDLAKDKNIAKLYEDLANAETDDQKVQFSQAIDAYINDKAYMLLDEGQEEDELFGPDWLFPETRGYKPQRDKKYGYGPAGSALKRQ
jgi:hypothetical protein